MNKIYSLAIVMMAGVLAMTSCSNDDEMLNESARVINPNEIAFDTGQKGISSKSGTTVTSLSDFYVRASTSDDENLVEYISDEEHYTRVFEMMRKVKQSLKIATGDLKNFNIVIENGKEKEMIKPCDFFLSLVERGIHVQVVSMKPYFFYNYTMENCPQLLDNPFFELRCNEHNHMKVFIFDDKCVYVGSANLTSAAIGKRARKTRNHEAGVLLWGSSLVEAPLQHFERVWNNKENI